MSDSPAVSAPVLEYQSGQANVRALPGGGVEITLVPRRLPAGQAILALLGLVVLIAIFVAVGWQLRVLSQGALLRLAVMGAMLIGIGLPIWLGLWIANRGNHPMVFRADPNGLEVTAVEMGDRVTHKVPIHRIVSIQTSLPAFAEKGVCILTTGEPKIYLQYEDKETIEHVAARLGDALGLRD